MYIFYHTLKAHGETLWASIEISNLFLPVTFLLKKVWTNWNRFRRRRQVFVKELMLKFDMICSCVVHSHISGKHIYLTYLYLRYKLRQMHWGTPLKYVVSISGRTCMIGPGLWMPCITTLKICVALMTMHFRFINCKMKFVLLSGFQTVCWVPLLACSATAWGGVDDLVKNMDRK